MIPFPIHYKETGCYSLRGVKLYDENIYSFLQSQGIKMSIVQFQSTVILNHTAYFNSSGLNVTDKEVFVDNSTISTFTDDGEKIFDADLECQFILYENENFTIEVFIIPAAQQKITPIAHLCLEVDNKEKFAKNCQANGLVVKKIPRGNSLLIFVKDYDGNLFEIKELQGCK